jgi:hypothetical protein
MNIGTESEPFIAIPASDPFEVEIPQEVPAREALPDPTEAPLTPEKVPA